jgi:hypothetical protein
MGAYIACESEWKPCTEDQVRRARAKGKDVRGKSEYEARLIIKAAGDGSPCITRRKCVQKAIAAGVRPGMTVYSKKRRDYGPMLVEGFNGLSAKPIRCRIKNGPSKTFFEHELYLTQT